MTISVLTADRSEEGRNMLWLVLETTDGVTGRSETFHASEAIPGRGPEFSADSKKCDNTHLRVLNCGPEGKRFNKVLEDG